METRKPVSVTSPPASLSARTLRSNIWRGILSASEQEIRDGMDSLGRFTRYTDENADTALDAPEMVGQSRYYPYPRFRAILGPAAREAEREAT